MFLYDYLMGGKTLWFRSDLFRQLIAASGHLIRRRANADLYNNNNNNNNNNHDDIYSAAIYGASHMRELTVVPLSESRSAPGGRQLVGQAANLTFESACRLL